MSLNFLRVNFVLIHFFMSAFEHLIFYIHLNLFMSLLGHRNPFKASLIGKI